MRSVGSCTKMAESGAVAGGEASNTVVQGPVVAPPKFVFGQNMSDRIKNVASSASSSVDSSPKPSEKTDSDGESESSVSKRPADGDSNKREFADDGVPLSPVKKVAKIFKADSEEEPRPFKLKPSLLNEVAKNLAGTKGEAKARTSPVPKTFGMSTSDASSTETRTGASSPEPLTLPKSQNYFQMFLNQKSDNSPKLEGSSNGGFVFGRNMGERVQFSVGEQNSQPEADKVVADTESSAEPAAASASPNKVEPKTLADVAKSCGTAQGPSSPSSSPDKRHLTLAEAAQVYQETAPQPIKSQLAKVAVVTGEEEERNVLQINCRLFLFEGETHTWKEKGRGTLRLNDMCQSMSESIFQSRLVMRTQGNLRVMLNTKLWPEMTLDRANDKSLRVTAVDGEHNDIKIYLIMGGPKDILQLYTAIDRRIQALKRGQQAQHSADSPVNLSASPQTNDSGNESTGFKDDKERQAATEQDDSSNDSNATGQDADKEGLSDDE